MSELQHPEATPLARAALDYITKLGWTIVTVGHNKRPLGEWGPSGTNRYDYTNTERCLQITAPGIGAIAGPSGIVIIDLDNADAIRLWTDRYGIPTTRIAKTPRGRHLYYQAPPGVHIPPGTEILPGIDVRGSESYAILPPSTLEHGTYTWLNTNPIEPLPHDVLDLLNNAKKERKHHITSGASFIEGGRNDHLTSMAGTMRRAGFNHSSILAAILEENKIRCVPPLPINEVEAIADSVCRYAPGDAYDIDTITLLRTRAATLEPDDAPILTTHTRLLNTRNLVLDEPEPINWIWDDFLAPGTLNMLHGEGGLGKSFIALKIAEQVVSPNAERVFDRAVHPGSVIIIDGENAESQIHRRIQHTTIQPDAALHVYIATDVILGLEEITETYFDHLNHTHTPSLIIIDSQRALWAGDEKEQGEAGRMLRRFARHIEDKPYAVLLIHHDNRGGDYSGSSDINAAITGCRIHIRRHTDKTKPNARILTQPKNRIAPEIKPQEFLLDIDQKPASHRTDQSGIRFTPYESDQNTIINQLVDQAITLINNPRPADHPEGVSFKQLRAAYGYELKDNGSLKTHDQEQWNVIVDRLEERGFVVKNTGQSGNRIVRQSDAN